jgi:hypothetical protein
MVKIIRTIWGPLNYVKMETKNKSFLPNEIVYVWGVDNEEYLKNLGYNTILVSKDNNNPLYGDMKTKYYHKLETIILADEAFKEYILVDWDTYLDKDIDDSFFELLRSKSNIQCPLYSLPNNFFDIISKYPMLKEFIDFFGNQNRLIPQFSWNFQNSRIIPNFCFFYSREAKIGKELMNIAQQENLYSNVEEFALYKWANCTLEEYIERYEPIVARGQLKDNIIEVQESLNLLNSFIDSKLQKENYIQHK